MTITTQTRKALWARSGNHCAICRERLAHEPVAGRSSLVGEECHIVARSPAGPRAGEPVGDRDGIDNLLLLCANCHKLVDDQPERYTVQHLRSAKREHEAWADRLGSFGARPTRADALERARRESRGRCVDRWQALGVSHELACELADDESVGVLPPQNLAVGPVTVLVGDLGVGKSLAGERLHQAAIAAALVDPLAPAPVWLRARLAFADGLDRAVAVADTLAGGGDIRDRAIALVVDGLDEAGPAAAVDLLAQARVLAEVRPGSRILLTTRMFSEVGNADERRVVPPLDRDQAVALMDRIHPDAPRQWHRLAKPLQDATRRPLFAVASAVLAAEGEAATAPADLIDRLVRRTLGDRWQALRRPLVEIAVRSVQHDGAPVRPQDAVPAHALDELLATRMVVEERGRLRFPLMLFAQWFAAQGIIDGRVDLQELFDDTSRLENWRYPLAIAAALAPEARAADVLEALTRRQPGFASIVLAEATAQVPRGEPDVYDALAAGHVLRRAAQSWIDGLAGLAPWGMPLTAEGALRPLGVDLDLTSDTGRLTTAWWAGPPDRPDVFLLPPWRSMSEVPESWGRVHSSAPVPGPAWPWVWVRDGIAHDLRRVLKQRALPLGGSPLEHEAVWDVASRLVDERIGGGLPVDEVLALDPYDQLRIRDTTIDIGSLQDALRRHATADGFLPHPWPPQEQVVAAHGPDAWARRAEDVFRMALDAYAWFAEHLLAPLASQLLTAVLLPARARGRLTLDSPNVTWWLEALQRGSPNEAEFSLWQPGESLTVSGEDFDRWMEQIRIVRPEVARWAWTPYQSGRHDLAGRCPATKLTYEQLWNDLRRLGWTNGHISDWSFWDLPDLRRFT